jgi:prepilin-type N-terminal cleavage/methylation domain-containing protein
MLLEAFMKRTASGFTLIEVAIVLVIAGLMLGGILKGQELINSARVKNLAADFRSAQLLLFAYQDNYRRLPGDDPEVGGANSRFGAQVGLAGGNADGFIAGAWDSGVLNDESALLWQHLRLANLASGSTNFGSVAAAQLPTNTFGGRFGLQSAMPIAGMRGSIFACSGGIPGALARQLDGQLDDGSATSGNLLAVTTGTATNTAAGIPNIPAAVAYADAATYTVCMGF